MYIECLHFRVMMAVKVICSNTDIAKASHRCRMWRVRLEEKHAHHVPLLSPHSFSASFIISSSFQAARSMIRSAKTGLRWRTSADGHVEMSSVGSFSAVKEIRDPSLCAEYNIVMQIFTSLLRRTLITLRICRRAVSRRLLLLSRTHYICSCGSSLMLVRVWITLLNPKRATVL